MAIESKAVANYLLELAKRDGESLSPMRVIKLAYISHGWHLGLLNAPLVDEYAEAWQFGPVIPSLYHEFKRFGDSPITTPALRLNPMTKKLVPYEMPQGGAIDSRMLVERVWEVYKRFNALQLSSMTHKEGTPWYITWHERGGKDIRGTDIETKLIQGHYDQLAKQQRERTAS